MIFFSYLVLLFRGLAATVRDYIFDSNSTIGKQKRWCYSSTKISVFPSPLSDLSRACSLCFAYLSPCNRFLLIIIGHRDGNCISSLAFFRLQVLTGLVFKHLAFETMVRFMLVPHTSIPEWLKAKGSIGSQHAAFHTVGADTEESEAREVVGISGRNGCPLVCQPHIMGCPLLWRKTVEK